MELELQTLLPRLEGLDPSVPQGFDPLLADLTPPARCALDLALWDWRGRRLQAPVWQLWGLDGARSVATSVTLGLAAVEQVLSATVQDSRGQIASATASNPTWPGIAKLPLNAPGVSWRALT